MLMIIAFAVDSLPLLFWSNFTMNVRDIVYFPVAREIAYSVWFPEWDEQYNLQSTCTQGECGLIPVRTAIGPGAPLTTDVREAAAAAAAAAATADLETGNVKPSAPGVKLV